MSLQAARQKLADQLTAAGIVCSLDPRNITPPGVLIGLPGQGQQITGCSYRAECPVTIVVPGPANADAAVTLLDLLDQVLATLNAKGFEYSRHQLGGVELPAYIVPVLITS